MQPKRLVLGLLSLALCGVVALSGHSAEQPQSATSADMTQAERSREEAKRAWDIFIALNMPAPDTGPTPADPGPRVWESWAKKSQVFPPSGAPLCTGDFAKHLVSVHAQQAAPSDPSLPESFGEIRYSPQACERLPAPGHTPGRCDAPLRAPASMSWEAAPRRVCGGGCGYVNRRVDPVGRWRRTAEIDVGVHNAGACSVVEGRESLVVAPYYAEN